MDNTFFSLINKKLGENCYREIDKEAKEETLKVLNFLMKYNDDKYIVIICD
jgi:hypothetical protein